MTENLMKVSEFLRRAKGVIDTPEKWVKGKFAVSAKGNEVEPAGRAACAWCSIGAVRKKIQTLPMGTSFEANQTRETECLMTAFLIDAVGEWCRRNPGNGHPGKEVIEITRFNDDHTHEQVMEMWDIAIELAEASEKQVEDYVPKPYSGPESYAFYDLEAPKKHKRNTKRKEK
jgi:hypothetical protein